MYFHIGFLCIYAQLLGKHVNKLCVISLGHYSLLVLGFVCQFEFRILMRDMVKILIFKMFLVSLSCFICKYVYNWTVLYGYWRNCVDRL